MDQRPRRRGISFSVLSPDSKPNLTALNALLGDTRIGSLSTLNQGAPFGSMVPFLWNVEQATAFVHLSRLARHTRHLADDPRAALLVVETDGPDKNPLALKRVCLTATALRIGPEDAAYAAIKAAYIERFPDSQMIFQLPDFAFYALAPNNVHWVAGFGQAFNIPRADLTCA